MLGLGQCNDRSVRRDDGRERQETIISFLFDSPTLDSSNSHDYLTHEAKYLAERNKKCFSDFNLENSNIVNSFNFFMKMHWTCRVTEDITEP